MIEARAHDGRLVRREEAADEQLPVALLLLNLQELHHLRHVVAPAVAAEHALDEHGRLDLVPLEAVADEEDAHRALNDGNRVEVAKDLAAEQEAAREPVRYVEHAAHLEERAPREEALERRLNARRRVAHEEEVLARDEDRDRLLDAHHGLELAVNAAAVGVAARQRLQLRVALVERRHLLLLLRHLPRRLQANRRFVHVQQLAIFHAAQAVYEHLFAEDARSAELDDSVAVISSKMLGGASQIVSKIRVKCNGT